MRIRITHPSLRGYDLRTDDLWLLTVCLWLGLAWLLPDLASSLTSVTRATAARYTSLELSPVNKGSTKRKWRTRNQVTVNIVSCIQNFPNRHLL